jgi:hypothetical protein
MEFRAGAIVGRGVVAIEGDPRGAGHVDADGRIKPCRGNRCVAYPPMQSYVGQRVALIIADRHIHGFDDLPVEIACAPPNERPEDGIAEGRKTIIRRTAAIQNARGPVSVALTEAAVRPTGSDRVSPKFPPKRAAGVTQTNVGK